MNIPGTGIYRALIHAHVCISNLIILSTGLASTSCMQTSSISWNGWVLPELCISAKQDLWGTDCPLTGQLPRYHGKGKSLDMYYYNDFLAF